MFHLSALLAGLLAVALSTVDNMPFVVQRTLIAVIFLLMFVLGRIVDLRTLFGAK